MKNVLRILALLLITISFFIFSYQGRTKSASAEVVYEDGSMVGSNIQFIHIREIKTYTVKEKEVAGVNVSKIDIKNRWNIELTEDEIDLLAKIVWLEARGEEEDKGQQAVVEVVLNRMRHWDFEGTLYEVLSRKNAFSTWKLRNTAKPTKREYKNIQKVLDGGTDITTPDTVYFSTSARNNKIDVIIGNHVFCKYELEKE